MNNNSDKKSQHCDACGGSRVVSGRLDGGEGGIAFEFPEYNWDYWLTLSNVPRTVDIRSDQARMCLDCGKVSATMSVDVEEAKRVLNKVGH